MTPSITTRRATVSPHPGARDGRLPLINQPRRRGFPDGAWCPHSTNLDAELPALVADLGEQGFLVERVLYNPTLWDPAPNREARGTRSVGLEASDALSSHVIRLLLIDSYRCIDLLVLFPTR